MSRLSLLTFIAVIGLAAGCHRVPPPGGAAGSRPEAARKRAEKLALSAVVGAAEAQASVPQVPASPRMTNPPPGRQLEIETPMIPTVLEPPEPKSPPRAGPPPIIRERVVSAVPLASEAEADAAAITAARDLLERKFAELDPPVRYRPSDNEVKNEFLRRDSKTVTSLREANSPRADAMRRLLKDDLGLSAEEIARRVDVEYDVEVTAEQVRHLRTRDRLGDALRVFGAFSAVALAGFLFLRADEWTKGYLTRWLAMGAVLLAGGAAAALYFV